MTPANTPHDGRDRLPGRLPVTSRRIRALEPVSERRARAKSWAERVGCPDLDRAQLGLMLEMERVNRG